MIDESTKKQRIEEAEKIRKKWEENPCPMCGETKWTPVSNNVEIDIRVSPVSYYCSVCGYIALYVIQGSIEAALEARKQIAMSVGRAMAREEE